MRETAFGALDLTHREFARLTPRELEERLAGFQWRQDREMERLAWLAATLINGLGNPKKPVSPVVLLGREKTHSVLTGERRMTPKELEASKRDLIAQLEG